MASETTKVVIGTLSGLVVGGLVGYVATQRALETKFDLLLDEEVAKVKEYYKGKYEGGDEESEEEDLSEEERLDRKHSRENPKKYVEEKLTEEMGTHAKIIQKQGYSSEAVYVSESVEKGETVRAGIIVEVDKDEDEWVSDKPIPPLAYGAPIDYSSKEVKSFLADRNTDEPYIITVDEFMEDYEEFEKQTLTYFEGDDTLCDDREMIIPDIDGTVGVKNLEHFGLYSRDRDIVFVRNERISTDFEIAYDDRTYVEAVAGFKYRKVNRMKSEDD